MSYLSGCSNGGSSFTGNFFEKDTGGKIMSVLILQRSEPECELSELVDEPTIWKGTIQVKLVRSTRFIYLFFFSFENDQPPMLSRCPTGGTRQYLVWTTTFVVHRFPSRYSSMRHNGLPTLTHAYSHFSHNLFQPSFFVI